MATVYKRRELRPIPDGAETITYRGKPYATWTDGKGKAQRAPLNAAGDRIIQLAECYTAQYFDEHGKRRKAPTGCQTRPKPYGTRTISKTKPASGGRAKSTPRPNATARKAGGPSRNTCRTSGRTCRPRATRPEHAEQTADRATRVMVGCGFEHIADISATAVESYLATLRDNGRSIQTSNHYLRAAKQFTRWLHRDRRTGDDPLHHLAMGNVKLDRRHDRRALTADEMQRLVNAAETGPEVEGVAGPDRAMMYVLSAWTGFRRREISSLTLRSLTGRPDACGDGGSLLQQATASGYGSPTSRGGRTTAGLAGHEKRHRPG